jgi:tripartite-type tricarboxylate transporter receptor subunit TctC
LFKVMNRRALLGGLLPVALGAAAAAAPRPAHAWTARAQGTAAAPSAGTAWPSERSIRFIVPVAPGGSQDVVARLLARHLTDELGQSVLVENLPGAGSNIGYEAAARSKPDGYTLLAGSDSLSINKTLFPRLGFDPVEGFAPVVRAVKVPQILVVRADSPARSLEAFVALARRDGAVAVGTPGNGSLAHLLGEQVQAAAEVRWTHVPYRGGALAVNDLLGGSLQGVLINIGAVTGHVAAGRMRGLFVSSADRTSALPEVPTLAEAGMQGGEAVGWHGIVAPAGTDPAIVAQVNGAVRRILRRPEVAERVAALGLEPSDEPPEALGTLIRADADRWAEVIRRARIQPD